MKKMPSPATVVAFVLILGLVGWGGIHFYKKSKADAAQTQAKQAESDKPIAQVQKLALTTLSDNLILPGVVRSDGVVAVTSFSEGLVAGCMVELGRRVVKGQVLCKIENDNPNATYLPYNIESPVAGVIGEIHAPVGTRVAKGDKIVTLLRSAKEKVELEVPVQDAARLRVGFPATWSLSRGPDATGADAKDVPLRITGISPLPNMTTRTVRIELMADKGEPGLPGALGKATFVFNRRDGFEVVEDALQYRGTTPFLRTVVDGKIKWIAVTLGRTQMGKVEIKAGVKAHDVVVTGANKFLAEGDEVVVKSEDFAKK